MGIFSVWATLPAGRPGTFYKEIHYGFVGGGRTKRRCNYWVLLVRAIQHIFEASIACFFTSQVFHVDP